MDKLYSILNNGEKKIAILIDPDKMNREDDLLPLIERLTFLQPSFLFIGGSSVDKEDFDSCIRILKSKTDLPLVIFPGSHQQINENADGLLFLSLISGRNPDFLIGHQVEAAHLLKKLPIEIIPTGYLLIDGGRTTSVSYISQTNPIPRNQNTIAVNTVIAGEMLGLKAIFMDAGSGADYCVSESMIKAVKLNTELPIIVGGGIKSIDGIETAHNAGADVVVIGNKIEENIDFLLDIKSYLVHQIEKNLPHEN